MGIYDGSRVPRAAKIVKNLRSKMEHSTGWRLLLFCKMLAVGRYVRIIHEMMHGCLWLPFASRVPGHR